METSIFLHEGAIDAQLIADQITILNKDKDSGGHALFLGQVRRDEKEGKLVKSIIYSAYETMVTQEMETIKNEMFEKYDDLRSIFIHHSQGEVLAGEISLLVLVSAKHRKHAFAALSEIVDLIKKRAPIWKKEVFNDNSHTWI